MSLSLTLKALFSYFLPFWVPYSFFSSFFANLYLVNLSVWRLLFKISVSAIFTIENLKMAHKVTDHRTKVAKKKRKENCGNIVLDRKPKKSNPRTISYVYFNKGYLSVKVIVQCGVNVGGHTITSLFSTECDLIEKWSFNNFSFFYWGFLLKISFQSNFLYQSTMY